jgi:hypothetical protein
MFASAGTTRISRDERQAMMNAKELRTAIVGYADDANVSVIREGDDFNVDDVIRVDYRHEQEPVDWNLGPSDYPPVLYIVMGASADPPVAGTHRIDELFGDVRPTKQRPDPPPRSVPLATRFDRLRFRSRTT